MPKKQDWLDIIEKASKPKKGTKLPKGVNVYSLSFIMEPNGRGGNGRMQPWNTGAGADGVVQPSKPVALDRGTNPPSVYHEGENVYPFPGGKKIVPAQTEQEQQGLAMEQKEMGYPGYQTGGTVYDDPNKLLMRLAPNPPNTIGSNSQPTTNVTPAQQTNQTVNRPTNVYDLSPTAQTYQTGQQTAFERTGLRAAGTDPLMENISNRALQNYDTRAAVSDTAMRQGFASSPYLTEGAKRAAVAKQQATYRAGLSGLVGDLSEASMRRMEEANREYYDMGRTGYQDELTKQRFEKTFGEQQYQSDVTQQRWREEFDFELQKYGDQEFARMADAAQTTSFDTWQTMFPGATQEDYNRAREYKNKQLESMDIGIDTGRETLAQLQKSGKLVDAQIFLDSGDIQGFANYVKDNLGINLDPTELQNIQNYNNSVRQATVTSMNNRVGDEIFGSIMELVNSGVDRDRINQRFPNINMTPSEYIALASDYTYKQDIQRATQTSVNNRVGDEIFGSIMEMINSGAGLDRVNQRYPDIKLTLPEYTDLKATTQAGQTEWNRGVQAISMLLSSGDPANIQQASAKIGELFPGISFSVDQMIQDIGADRFAGGLTDLATLASTFPTWDAAKASAEGLGIINNLGMGVGTSYDVIDSNGNVVKTVDNPDEAYDATRAKGYSVRVNTSQAQELFEGLQINALDESWQAITESDFYKYKLDDDQRELVNNTFIAGVTGELEMDITRSYEVNDADGKFVKSFDSITDAENFVSENADKNYSIDEKKNYQFRSLYTGDTFNFGGTGDKTGDGEKGIAKAFDEFYGTIPGDEDVTLGAWIKAGKPKSYDEYLELLPTLPSTIPLESIDIEKYSDLLSKENFEKLISAYNSNPDDVKGSEFFYEVPDIEYIANNIQPDQKMSGTKNTKLTGDFKKNLEDSIGKMIELPLREGVLAGESIPEGQTTISGQLVDVDETPNTIQLKIKTADGTTKSYVLFSWDKIGDPQKDNAQGTIMGQPYEDKTYKV